jgi:hypothetical protein
MPAYWPEAGRAAVVCALALAGFWGGVWLLTYFRRRKECLHKDLARAAGGEFWYAAPAFDNRVRRIVREELKRLRLRRKED